MILLTDVQEAEAASPLTVCASKGSSCVETALQANQTIVSHLKMCVPVHVLVLIMSTSQAIK